MIIVQIDIFMQFPLGDAPYLNPLLKCYTLYFGFKVPIKLQKHVSKMSKMSLHCQEKTSSIMGIQRMLFSDIYDVNEYSV